MAVRAGRQVPRAAMLISGYAQGAEAASPTTPRATI